MMQVKLDIHLQKNENRLISLTLNKNQSTSINLKPEMLKLLRETGNIHQDLSHRKDPVEQTSNCTGNDSQALTNMEFKVSTQQKKLSVE